MPPDSSQPPTDATADRYPFGEPSSAAPQFDPVYLNARRESVWLLVAFVVFLVWTVGTSYYLGYRQPDSIATQMVWGLPAWVFWGVVVPWLAASVFTFAFCLFVMADDRLEEQGSDEFDPAPTVDGNKVTDDGTSKEIV